MNSQNSLASIESNTYNFTYYIKSKYFNSSSRVCRLMHTISLVSTRKNWLFIFQHWIKGS